MNNPTATKAWQALYKEAQLLRANKSRITELFATNPYRFEDMSLRRGGFLFDYSKQLVSASTLENLLALADQCNLKQAITAMFDGEKINLTENRAAHHVSLRRPEGRGQSAEVKQALDKLSEFVKQIHDGAWHGATGKPITQIVNVGIGGSDLGPALVVDALADFKVDGIGVHFVSNVDPSHMHSVVSALSAEQTLFIIASKSFSTLETFENAGLAKKWLAQNGIEGEAIAKHFVASTSNVPAAEKFGIATENIFPMWDWVGGRYSLWSAIGLPIALAVGNENFQALLSGAYASDRHFSEAEFSVNIPVIMALISIWNSNFLQCSSSALIPYSQRLNLLPDYLQQLYMESLGKRVNASGSAIDYRTGEAIWGTAGTNGQHSYFQLLHQGTELIPVDFVAFCTTNQTDQQEQHEHLLANCLSQSKALMEGDTQPSQPYRNVPGNKPSSTLLVDSLTPFNLGSLIALYEHRVFVQSVIWDINAFDQWGVQLGKVRSEQVYQALITPSQQQHLDASTQNLIQHLQRQKK